MESIVGPLSRQHAPMHSLKVARLLTDDYRPKGIGASTSRLADAELPVLAEVVRVAIHDLGGLAIALALRADTLAVSPADETAHAMHDIAREVRVISRRLHQLQSPPVVSQFQERAPTTLQTWFSENERFALGVLGLGTSLHAEIGDGVIAHADAAGLSYVVLACCLDVRDRRRAASPTLTISISATGAAVRVRLVVTCDDEHAPPLRAQPSRWQRIAREVSARHAFGFDATTPSTVIIDTPLSTS